MDFTARIGKAPRSGVFELPEEGFLVWCGTMIREHSFNLRIPLGDS